MPAIPPEDDGSPTRPNQLPTLDLPTDKALDRYLRQPRTETDDLHDRFLEMGHRGAKDEQLGVAAVLARRNMATTAEREVAQAHKAVGLQRPAQPLTTDAWKLLYHPDQDRTTGEIFSVIASAVLLARVTAMREGEFEVNGEIVRAANIIWGAGIAAHPLTRTLGVDTDRAGRVTPAPP